MSERTAILVIFVNEADLWRDTPLYEAIIRRLRELKIAGATAHAGLMGFGRHHFVHEQGMFGMAVDRPVTITVVDSEEKLRATVPELRTLVQEGLILFLPAEVVQGL